MKWAPVPSLDPYDYFCCLRFPVDCLMVVERLVYCFRRSWRRAKCIKNLRSYVLIKVSILAFSELNTCSSNQQLCFSDK